MQDQSCLNRAIERAARFLERELSAEGALLGTCESRPLESALLALTLRELGLVDEAPRLFAYLRREAASEHLQPTSARLVARALGEARERRGEARAASATVSTRKAFLIGVLESLADVADPPSATLPSSARSLHTFAQLPLRAAGVIAACLRNDMIDPSDARYLADALAAPWGDHHHLGLVTATLALALLASHPQQASLAPSRARLEAAARSLIGRCGEDGGLSFIAAMEVFTTATALLALVECGQLGEPSARMAAFLSGQQTAQGSFAYAAQCSQTDTDSTAYALEALEGTGSAHLRTAALAYVADTQNADGGIPTYRRGDPSEIVMSAGMLCALLSLPPSLPGLGPIAERLLAYLLAHVEADSWHETSWSLSALNAPYRLSGALRTAQRAAWLAPSAHTLARIDRARETVALYVLERADAGFTLPRSHGFGQHDLIGASYALCVLTASSPQHSLTRRTADYVLAQQRPDGSFCSIPDQCGPRPFRYDVPVLATNVALLALGRYRAALSPTERPLSSRMEELR